MQASLWGGGAYDTNAQRFLGRKHQLSQGRRRCSARRFVGGRGRGARAVRGGCERRRARRPASFISSPLHALPASAGNGERKTGSSLEHLRFDAFGRRFDIAVGSNDRLMASKTGAVVRSSCIAARSTASPDRGCGTRKGRRTARDDMGRHAALCDRAGFRGQRRARHRRRPDASQTIVFRLADAIDGARRGRVRDRKPPRRRRRAMRSTHSRSN